jgi:DNA helicase-2/ATP-dependent DNA helicase PcrA
MHEVPGARQTAGFTVYDSEDSESVMRNALTELGFRDTPEDKKLHEPGEFQDLVSRAKSALPCAHARTGGEAFDALVRVGKVRGEGDTREVVFKSVFDDYNAALARANALDFDDLISFTVAALTHSPDLASRLAARWPHVLVDEFQDTNLAQYEFVRQIASGGAGGVHTAPHQDSVAASQRSPLVVGDSDQSIYGWRGAEVELMRERFPRDMRASSAPLAANYRSTPQICAAAEAVLAGSTERSELRMRPISASGPPVSLWTVDNGATEAAVVADEIAHLLSAEGGGLSGSSIAVLYRVTALSRGMEQALLKRNIKCVVIGGTPFFGRTEIKDLTCYLRLISNSCDNVAFHRIINTPARRISPKTVDALGCARACACECACVCLCTSTRGPIPATSAWRSALVHAPMPAALTRVVAIACAGSGRAATLFCAARCATSPRSRCRRCRPPPCWA